MKTFRFAKVVEKAGTPEPYNFWLDPKKDQRFQQLLKSQRVMTVHQEMRGSKKDFGTVGCVRDGKGEILVFPKSIKAFADARIVAIDYNLLKRSESVPQTRSKKAPGKIRSELEGLAETRVGKNSAAKTKAEATKDSSLANEAEVEKREDARTVVKGDVVGIGSKKLRPILSAASLLEEVKKALKEMRAGKNAAASERLEAAIKRRESVSNVS